MSSAAPPVTPLSDDPRAALREAVDHLDHVLPGQAPILNFVHHNTLHGYQHLPFWDALDAAERLTGNRAYLPDDNFRAFGNGCRRPRLSPGRGARPR